VFGLARRIKEKLDHRWALRRMFDYIDGDLTPRQQRRLEAHARLCPECGPLRRALTVLVWELRELGRRRRTSSVSAGVIERLRGERFPPESGARPTRP
jgi:anti-sigma factor RsiW